MDNRLVVAVVKERGVALKDRDPCGDENALYPVSVNVTLLVGTMVCKTLPFVETR